MIKVISSKLFLWVIAILSILLGILFGYIHGGESKFPKAEHIIKGKVETIFLKGKKENIIIAPSKLDF